MVAYLIHYGRFPLLCGAILMFAVMAFGQQQTVELRLDGVHMEEDHEGNRHHTAYIGEPFMLKIIMRGNGKRPSTMAIMGTETFSSNNPSISSSIRLINGAMSSEFIYTYEMTGNQAGSFILGPVIIDGRPLSGEKVPIVIRPRTEADGPADDEDEENIPEHGECFAKLVLAKDQIVEGEPTILSLQVFQRGTIYHIEHDPVTVSGAILRPFSQELTRIEQRQGREYKVTELRYLLVPTTTGTKEIGPLRVAYRMPVQMNISPNSPFGFIDAFMGPRLKTAMIRTNQAKLMVTALPPHKGPVDGVGSFDQYTLQTDKPEVMINEPVRITVELAGTAYLDQIPSPQLTVPTNCRIFESKSEVQQDLNFGLQRGIKRFEYVVQPSSLGELTIPPQVFTFYDPQSATYKSLHTNPLTLQVQAPQGYVAPTPPVPPAQSSTEAEQPAVQDIHYIEEELGSPRSVFALPWWLLVMLCSLIPLALFAKPLAQWFMQCRTTRKKSTLHYQKLREVMILALDRHEGAAIHRILITFFSQATGVAPERISHETINTILMRWQWNTDDIQNLLTFLDEAATFVYTSQKLEGLALQEFRKKALAWLNKLIDSHRAQGKL